LTGLAAGFGVDVRELRRLAGRPPGELGPYVPTAEASSLTQPQRNALDQLIKAFVSEGGSHGLADSAEKSARPPLGGLGAELSRLADPEPPTRKPSPPRSLAEHKRARIDRDALPADTAADDGSDSDGPGE